MQLGRDLRVHVHVVRCEIKRDEKLEQEEQLGVRVREEDKQAC
jgi:hypothetical protein